MAVIKTYLALYNLFAALSWAYTLYLTASCYFNGDTPAETWATIGWVLKCAQTSALLECLHSLFRLVRSPLLTTLLQVASRIVLLWGFTHPLEVCQQHWSLFLMVGSWSSVEVPRYLFYFSNLAFGGVPNWLFWLRYNLFAILYPTGISGELIQVWTSLPVYKTHPTLSFMYTVGYVLLAIYAPCGPFMYSHMVVQRAKNTKKRYCPKPKVRGLQFPLTKKGDRSTTKTNRGCFAASMRAVNEAKAEKIERENKWRFGYPKYIVDHVKQGMRNDGKDALTMAQAGLDFCYEKFEFVVDDHSTVSLKEAMKGDVAALSSTQFTTICTDDFISTATDTKNNNVDASGSDQQYSYTLPYQGDELTGEALVQQLDCWAEKGIIEPDTRDYIRDIALSNNLDLSGHYFTLLGATSAMGPFNILLRMNANIIAIARPSTDKWNRIFATIRDLKSRFSNVGRVYLPSSLTDGIDTLNDNGDHSVNIDQIAASAGADLMTQTPQILKWLLNDFDDEKEMLVGMYGYLDSGKHVLLTLASDAIMQGLIQRRSGAVSLAFLPSPTDVFIVPASLKLACDKNRQKAPVWQQVLSTVSSSMLNSNSSKKDNIEGTSKYAINNGLSTAQGPNYALAKRIQHWRAMLAESQDCNVSSNVAPAACTASVTSNKTFAAVYGGFHHFSPLEVMEQATAAHMMTALTLHDILVKGKAKKEGKEKSRSDVPLALFISGAFHGGIWRCGYVMDSIGAPALIMYYMSKYGVGLLALVAGAVAGTVAGVDFTAALPFTLPVLP